MAAFAVIIVVVMAGILGGFIIMNNSTDDETGTTLEITDWRGDDVTIPKYPQRIVSLGGSFTEVLFSIGAQDQIVGVDKYSDYPPAALEKTNVGSGYTLNQEAVMVLDPDCVICWGYQTDTIETLEGLGVPVLVYYPGTVEEILWTIESLGNVTGRVKAAQDLVSGMEQIIDGISSALSNLTDEDKPKVYFELKTGKSVGPGTITNDLIEMAGGINIYGDAPTKYPQPSSEYIIDVNPDIIIIEDQSLKTNNDIATLEGWDAIDAVENNQIFRIDQNLNTVTPRLVEALETFAHWFHPDQV
jgi:iron complex transport system substrate-binding protein